MNQSPPAVFRRQRQEIRHLHNRDVAELSAPQKIIIPGDDVIRLGLGGAFQYAIVLAFGVWLVCVKLFNVRPSIGSQIAVLAVLAAIVTIWPPDGNKWGKASWVLVSFRNSRGITVFGTGRYLGHDRSVQPDLILLDLKLPQIDGLEVLRRLRSEDQTWLLPAVILTSSREEVDLIRGYSLGANSYICRPLDFEDFVEMVRLLRLYWLGLNEPLPPHRVLSARQHE